MTTVRFDSPSDSITLLGGADAAEGFFFGELTDWYSGAESKSEVRERPQGDGAFGVGSDWSTSLAVSVKGFFVGADQAAATRAAARISALRHARALVKVTVDDADGSTHRWVSVRRVGVPDFKAQRAVEFTVDMVALDPFRYGEPEVSFAGVPVSGGGLLFPLGDNPDSFWDFGADGVSGRVSVSNPGTAETWPDLEVSGGLSGGFVVTNVTTGQSVRFVRPIPDGSVVRVNQRTGRAQIDGQSDVSVFLTERGFFSVPAGETHQVQFTPLGTVSGVPQLTVTSRAAYA